MGPHDVHLIYAVREFAGLLPSESQERIKQAMDAPFDAWLRRVATRWTVLLESDAAARIAATLVGELSALRWPEGGNVASSAPGA
jgi:hypothetical protein